MLEILKNLIHDENGQGMVEYGLVLGVLAMGSVFVIGALRFTVEDLIGKVAIRLSEEIYNISSL